MIEQLELHADEIAHLARSGRCDACGHLEALHNDHCCVFCMVDDCLCSNGRIPGPPPERKPLANPFVVPVRLSYEHGFSYGEPGEEPKK